MLFMIIFDLHVRDHVSWLSTNIGFTNIWIQSYQLTKLEASCVTIVLLFIFIICNYWNLKQAIVLLPCRKNHTPQILGSNNTCDSTQKNQVLHVCYTPCSMRGKQLSLYGEPLLTLLINCLLSRCIYAMLNLFYGINWSGI